MRLVVRWSTACAVSVAAFALSWWVCQEQIHLDEGAALGLAGAVLALVLAVGGWWAVREPPDKDAERETAKVADRLASAVNAQLKYETTRRRIFRPYPLPVCWVAADRTLFDPWSVLVRQAEGSPSGAAEMPEIWAADPAELAGEGKELADILNRVPTRRLVVLGEPGAGKSILLIRVVLELLSPERRKEGGAVPVLLPTASWNPAAEDLHSWIVRWLATDPAGLARITPNAPSMARALLDADLILPVLDGFDEIPDAVRGSAIIKINEAIASYPGLILAARTDAYQDAVHGKDGSPIDGAAGIELCPLDADTVADYLKKAADAPAVADRWEVVTASFSARHPPPVARVLTTPLMVTLARAIYNPRDNEGTEAVQHQPAELLDNELFQTEAAVRDYLLDKFIWAAYRPHHDPSHPSRRYPWDYEQARRWLVFLARNQQAREDGRPDIAWWRLKRAAPRYLVATVLASTLAIIATVGYPFVGFGIGVTAGILTGIAIRRLRPAAERGITRGLFGGLAGGAAAGLIATAALPPGPHHYGLGAYLAGALGVGIAVSVLGDFLAGLVAGFTGGITVTFYENASVFSSLRTWIGAGSHVMNGIGIALAAILTVDLASRRKVPAHKLRWSFLWMAGGAGCGLVIGFISWIQLGRTTGLLVGIAATVAGGLTGTVADAVESKPARAAAPSVVLRHDRDTFLRSWLGFGAALGLITGFASSISPGPTGHPNGVKFGIEVGLSNIIVPGLVLAFIQAQWGTFGIARCWLALNGQIPWRLMAFLQDAYDRGVFRQVGAVYRFRHIDLQRRIAGGQAAPSLASPSPSPALGLSRSTTLPAPARAPIRATLAKTVIRWRRR